MRPAINDGDRIFVRSNVDSIERGDIIFFRYPADPEKYYLKRVIGLPGEKIDIQDGTVFINGEMLEESYVDPNFNKYRGASESINVLADHYFVMGDNRENSSDSRVWGTLDKVFIEGKYYTTY